MENAREFQKNTYYCFIDYDQAFGFCGSQQTGKFFKRQKYQTTLPISREVQLEPDIEQWTGSKLGKEYIKAVYCHPAYLTYMQNTL